MSFLKLVRNLVGTSPIETVKAGEVAPATRAQIEAECPELLKDIGIPAVGAELRKNSRGETGMVVDGFLPQNKGCRWFFRKVVVSPAIARWITENYGGHNRESTKPAVERYAEQMTQKQWNFVGNTLCFVVDTEGNLTPLGVCNGGHTCKAIVKSGQAQEMLLIIGIPERHANKADVNIARTAKHVIERLHRYDLYNGMNTDEEGNAIGITLDPADLKSMSEIHSQALRILACVMAKKAVKDSEPLGPDAIAALDVAYGHLLQPCVRDVYLLDRAVTYANKTGKQVAGALKYRLSLSHAAAVMAVLAATGDVVSANPRKLANLTLDQDTLTEVGKFFADLVNADLKDEDNPAVCLRLCLERHKLNKMTNQNVRWNCLTTALYATIELAANAEPSVSYDVDSLMAIGSEATDRICFNTILDPEAPKKVESTATVAELPVANDLEEIPE